MSAFIEKSDRLHDRIIKIAKQEDLFMPQDYESVAGRYFHANDIELDYDTYVVFMSGGKDSIATLLTLLEKGVDPSKIELHHHLVDGMEGEDPTFMDWDFMADYNRKLGELFEIPTYFSGVYGGLLAEMTKRDDYSRDTFIEGPGGMAVLGRDLSRSKRNTRMMFPQQAADLRTRWCSSHAKVDVGRKVLTSGARFLGKKTLVLSGERREESASRSKYYQFEQSAADAREGRLARHVDHWRPVLNMSEEEVWGKLATHGIIAPVPYRLGWSRSSCQTCIFNGPNIWATMFEYFPSRAEAIEEMEKLFGKTISRSQRTVREIAAEGKAFDIKDAEALAQAVSPRYTLPVVLSTGQKWELPPGAFSSESAGS